MKLFLEFLEDKGLASLASLTLEHLESYRQKIFFSTHKGKPLKATTQSFKLGAIKSFTRFLHRDGILLMNPGLLLELPRHGRSLPRQILSEKEILKLLEAPNIETQLGIRDRTILEVFYATGMRNSELSHLDVGEFDREARQLRIQEGKGGKTRLVPVGDEAMAWLEDYLQRVRPQLLRRPSQQKIFLSWRGERLAKDRLTSLITGYGLQAGITKHVTPHVLRHSCATHMLMRGASLRHVQLLLGHSSVATTEIYTHVELSDLAKIMRRCHPRERLGL